MTRLEAFNSFATDAWYKRVHKRLKASDVAFCTAFIEQNDSLDIHAFEMRVNRLFIDDRNRPKLGSLIVELLASANSRAHLR
jgi:hypothetical protein